VLQVGTICCTEGGLRRTSHRRTDSDGQMSCSCGNRRMKVRYGSSRSAKGSALFFSNPGIDNLRSDALVVRPSLPIMATTDVPCTVEFGHEERELLSEQWRSGD